MSTQPSPSSSSPSLSSSSPSIHPSEYVDHDLNETLEHYDVEPSREVVTPTLGILPSVDSLKSVFTKMLHDCNVRVANSIEIVGAQRSTDHKRSYFRYQQKTSYAEKTIDSRTKKSVAVLNGFKLIQCFVEIFNQSCREINSDYTYKYVPTKEVDIDNDYCEEFKVHDNFREFLSTYHDLFTIFYSYIQDDLYSMVRIITCNLLVRYTKTSYEFYWDGRTNYLNTHIRSIITGDEFNFEKIVSVKEEMGLVSGFYDNKKGYSGVPHLFANALRVIGTRMGKNIAVPSAMINNAQYCTLLAISAIGQVTGANYTLAFNGKQYGYHDLQTFGRDLIRDPLHTATDGIDVGTPVHMCNNVATALSDTLKSIPTDHQQDAFNIAGSVVANLMCLLQEELIGLCLDARTTELELLALDGIFGSEFAGLIWNKVMGKARYNFSETDMPIVTALLNIIVAPVGMPDGLIKFNNELDDVYIDEDMLIANGEWFLNPLSSVGIIILTSLINANENSALWLVNRFCMMAMRNYRLAETVFNKKDEILYLPADVPFTNEDIIEANEMLKICMGEWPYTVITVREYNRVVNNIHQYTQGRQLTQYTGINKTKVRAARPRNENGRVISNKAVLKESLYNWLITNTRYNPLYPIRWLSTNSQARAKEIRDGLRLPLEYGEMLNETVRGIYAKAQTDLAADVANGWIVGWDFSSILMDGEQHYVDIENTRSRKQAYNDQLKRFQHFHQTGEVIQREVTVTDKDTMIKKQRDNNQSLRVEVNALKRRIEKLEEIVAKMGVDL